MLHMAHASRFHWEQVGTPAHLVRGEWLCSRVYAMLARAHAVDGDAAAARRDTEHALAAADQVADADDRQLVLDDLATIPGQPRFW